MTKALFPQGIIKIKDEHGNIHLAEYIGRQEGFECCICQKGGNCYTFNIFKSVEEYKKGNYETWGYGREHINLIKLVEDKK
jgi:hypothetical protein